MPETVLQWISAFALGCLGAAVGFSPSGFFWLLPGLALLAMLILVRDDVMNRILRRPVVARKRKTPTPTWLWQAPIAGVVAGILARAIASGDAS